MGRGSDEVFRDLLGLQEEIYRLFDESTVRLQGEGGGAGSSHWTPAVDIYESTDGFVLVAELPGMTRDQIDLEIRPEALVLRGERPLLPCGDDRSYHRIERANGMFQRTFHLPARVDGASAKATYVLGVLTVHLPLHGGGGERTVRVEVGG